MLKNLNAQSVVLDALKRKIRQAKNELEQYKNEYTQCQITLINEIAQRNICETANMRLERRNAALESELQLLHEQLADRMATLRNAHAALSESDRLRKAMEQRNQLQMEKINLLIWELTKIKRLTAEADNTALMSTNRVATLADKLAHCEQQLEASIADNAVLQAELHAASKNVYCVELTAERSAQRVDKCEHKLDQLQRQLRESEQRALSAECSVKKLQLSAERLEERWHSKLRDLGVRLS